MRLAAAALGNAAVGGGGSPHAAAFHAHLGKPPSSYRYGPTAQMPRNNGHRMGYYDAHQAAAAAAAAMMRSTSPYAAGLTPSPPLIGGHISPPTVGGGCVQGSGGSSSPSAMANEMQIRCKFGQLGADSMQFNSPHGFCLGHGEEIIVADTQNHRIQVERTCNCVSENSQLASNITYNCNFKALLVYCTNYPLRSRSSTPTASTCTPSATWARIPPPGWEPAPHR